MVDATTSPAAAPLLPELFALLAAHRPAFRQERPYHRSVALVLGWLCAFGRHTLTQVLLALGLGQADWTAWYRLFSRPRLDYARLSGCLVRETLALAPPDGPYLVGVDATQLPRHSRTLPGTSWLRHPGTAIFRAGIHRAQRFGHLAWLAPPTAAGYSRAVPLRLDPAFPPKAVPVPDHPPRKEWETGLAALRWTRAQLDTAGRERQALLAVGDGQGGWTLPWPAEQLVAWAWQRWELEVAHRELKTSFGWGEPQAWSPVAAVLTVQWTAWVYAVLLLAGLRAWGLGPGPVRPPGRWWRGSGRWSLARLWQGYRQELWGEQDFHRVWLRTGSPWDEMADWLAARTNATLAASRT